MKTITTLLVAFALALRLVSAADNPNNPCIGANTTTICITQPSTTLRTVSPNAQTVCLGDPVSASTSKTIMKGSARTDTTYDNCPTETGTPYPVEPTIIREWWVANGPGAFTATGSGLSTTFTPTEPGQGTVTFYCEWNSPTPCTASGIPSAAASFEVKKPSGWKASSEVGREFELPVWIKDKVNAVIHAIPGCRKVTVHEAKAAVSAQVKDCCTNNTFVANGQKQFQASVTLSAKMKDIPVWATPTISKKIDFGVAIIEVDFEFGIYVGADFSVTGLGGYRTDECGSEDCGFGELKAGVNVGLRATVEAIFCTETWWTSRSCTGLTITPASLSAEFMFGLGYNANSCSDGFSGTAHVGKLTFQATFDLDIPATRPWTYSVELSDGFTQ